MYFCVIIKKNAASSESGDIERLWVSGDLYDVPNRFGVVTDINPMLRGLAQLQKVAENDHFCCGVAPTPRPISPKLRTRPENVPKSYSFWHVFRSSTWFWGNRVCFPLPTSK